MAWVEMFLIHLYYKKRILFGVKFNEGKWMSWKHLKYENIRTIKIH